jgi:hypothetical protein
MKLHEAITNREFKLLIKPKGLDRRRKITELSDQILKFCKKSKVEFFHLDNALPVFAIFTFMTPLAKIFVATMLF